MSKRHLFILLPMGMACLLAACFGGGGGGTPVPKLKLAVTAPEFVQAGATVEMSAAVQGGEAGSTVVTWESSGGGFVDDIGLHVNWTAPDETGTYHITVRATSGSQSARVVVDVEVVAAGGGNGNGGNGDGGNGDGGGDDFTMCDSGDPDDRANPCIIVTLEQLQAMKDYAHGHFALGADIDAWATRSWNDGRGFEPIGDNDPYFTGSFDGRGHVITGLYIHKADFSLNRAGLFAVATRESDIRNVGIVDANITGRNEVGGLVGHNEGTITNSYSTGTVEGYRIVGGLVGVNMGGLARSFSLSTVTGEFDYVGGLAGSLYKSSYLPTFITDSYSHGSVTGYEAVGGLVGSMSGNADLSNAYSTGAVVVTNPATDRFGGLVGYRPGVTRDALSSYWNVETSGQIESYEGEGRTTAQMKQPATFIGWDFVGVWTIDPGMDYPDLVDNPRP